MPLDVSTRTLTLADLAWRLRHPETWPPGFKWDYGNCSSCAMGLAVRLLDQPFPDDIENWMANQFPEASDGDPELPLLNEWAESVFLEGLHPEAKLSEIAHTITPAMVADAIDQWLEKGR